MPAGGSTARVRTTLPDTRPIGTRVAPRLFYM